MPKFIRKRAGRHNRPNRIAAQANHWLDVGRTPIPYKPKVFGAPRMITTSTTARAEQTGIYYECLESKPVYSGSDIDGIINQPVEDHSLTERLELRTQRTVLEVTDQPCILVDPSTGESLRVIMNGNGSPAGGKLAWKSDRTLMNRSKPFEKLERLKRETAYSKEREVQPGETDKEVVKYIPVGEDNPEDADLQLNPVPIDFSQAR